MGGRGVESRPSEAQRAGSRPRRPRPIAGASGAPRPRTHLVVVHSVPFSRKIPGKGHQLAESVASGGSLALTWGGKGPRGVDSGWGSLGRGAGAGAGVRELCARNRGRAPASAGRGGAGRSGRSGAAGRPHRAPQSGRVGRRGCRQRARPWSGARPGAPAPGARPAGARGRGATPGRTYRRRRARAPECARRVSPRRPAPRSPAPGREELPRRPPLRVAGVTTPSRERYID